MSEIIAYQLDWTADRTAHEGWANIKGATKFHYVVAGKSLCGRYHTLTNIRPLLNQRNRPPDTDCSICRRRLLTHYGDQIERTT